MLLKFCRCYQISETTIQPTIHTKVVKKWPVSVNWERNWKILACNSFNALANCKNVCHTFTSDHFTLKNNMSKTSLRCIKVKIWLAFATKPFANKISFWKGSLVSSLIRILPSLPDNFSVVYNMIFFWLAFVMVFGPGRGKYPLLIKLFYFWNLNYIK